MNWKLLADLNISLKTVAFLQFLGLDIKRIDKSLNTDDDVIELAKKENRVILTFDKDFGEIYHFRESKKISVIILYLKNQTSEEVNKILERFFDQFKFEKIENKLVIVYENKCRIK